MRCWYVSSARQTDALSLGASAPLSNNNTALIRQYHIKCFEWCMKSSSPLLNSVSITLGPHLNMWLFIWFFSTTRLCTWDLLLGRVWKVSAVCSNRVFLASGWQTSVYSLCVAANGKNSTRWRFVSSSARDRRVVSSRLGRADRISRRLQRPLLSSDLPSYSREVCWLWSGWVRLLQVAGQPVRLQDESVANQHWK